MEESLDCLYVILSNFNLHSYTQEQSTLNHKKVLGYDLILYSIANIYTILSFNAPCLT